MIDGGRELVMRGIRTWNVERLLRKCVAGHGTAVGLVSVCVRVLEWARLLTLCLVIR